MNDRQLITETEAILGKIKSSVEYIPTWIRNELARLHGAHAAQLGTPPTPAPAPSVTSSGPAAPVQPVQPPPPPPATETKTFVPTPTPPAPPTPPVVEPPAPPADDYWEGHTLFDVAKKHSDATYVGEWRHPGNVIPADELTKAIQQEAATIYFQQLKNSTLTLGDAFLISAVDLFAFNKGSDSAPEWDEAAVTQAKTEIAAAQAEPLTSSEV